MGLDVYRNWVTVSICGTRGPTYDLSRILLKAEGFSYLELPNVFMGVEERWKWKKKNKKIILLGNRGQQRAGYPEGARPCD